MTPTAKSWKVYPMPKSKSGTYAVYVDDKDRVWATDWMANAIQRFDPVNRKLRDLPERQAWRQRAPDARPPRRNVGRRIRQRSPGGRSGTM